MSFGKCFSLRLAVLALLAMSPSAYAGTINGTVTNKTVDKPSAGDTVSLLSLSAGLEELSNTRTDARGKFTLTTPSADAPYLIKVEHQKGSYFKNMRPGATTAEVTVYDVATKVEGVSTEADVLRIESDNGQLKVTENYFVKNASTPPRTESKEHTYEVVLPPNAVLEGAATVGPSNMPLAATPDPISPKGHYAFSFPIRPNEGDSGTRFQLTYHVPYTGSFKFAAREMQGTDNLAIMLPRSMKLEPASGAGFQSMPQDVNAQTFLARNIEPGQTVEFTVSGTGALPRDEQPGGAGGGAGPGAAAQASDASPANGPNGTPGGGLGNPIDTPDPLSKYKYWILGGLAVVLAAAAAFLLRKPSEALGAAPVPMAAIGATAATAGVAAAPASRNQLLLDALKDELFAIESEKIAGKLSATDYVELKSALETVLKRALGRQAS